MARPVLYRDVDTFLEFCDCRRDDDLQAGAREVPLRSAVGMRDEYTVQ
jgi:hypothetical protein